MSAHTMTAKPMGKRTAAMLFAPLAILVTAAVVTQFGGGVAKDAKAASVSVTATINSNTSMTACGTIALGASLNPNQAYQGSCNTSFTSTNSSSVLNVSAAAGLGMAGFTNAGGACAALTGGQAGISVLTAGTDAGITPNGSYNCNTAAQFVAAPAAPTALCTAAASNATERNCHMEVGIHTGGVSGGSKTGSLTINVA